MTCRRPGCAIPPLGRRTFCEGCWAGVPQAIREGIVAAGRTLNLPAYLGGLERAVRFLMVRP